MAWSLTPEEARKRKEKADREGWRPTPKWILKKWADKGRAASVGAGKILADKERRRRQRKLKRARALARMNAGGPMRTIPDYDEDYRKEFDEREMK